MHSSQQTQVLLTDPDARSMATSMLGSAVVRYNVRAAVDAKHHLIVAHEVTKDVTDCGLVSTMAKAAKQAAARPKPIVLADRGYCEGRQILECEHAGNATMRLKTPHLGRQVRRPLRQTRLYLRQPT